jgi:hypothetical protein
VTKSLTAVPDHDNPLLNTPRMPRDEHAFRSINMTRNMGTLDKGLRLAIAAALVLAAFTALQGGALFWVALAIAAVFTLTSVVSFCPLYTVLGLKTSKSQ